MHVRICPECSRRMQENVVRGHCAKQLQFSVGTSMSLCTYSFRNVPCIDMHHTLQFIYKCKLCTVQTLPL